MRATIGDLSRGDKPAKPLLRFAHSLDTTSFFFRIDELMTIEQKRLRELYDGHKPRRFPNERGHVLLFQCPRPELIWECERLCVKYRGNHSRVDVSSDDQSNADYIEQTKRLLDMMILRGRRAGLVGMHENQDGTMGVYMNPYSRALGERPPPRDDVIYPDPCSKLLGRPAAHFDHRLRREARLHALRAQDIEIGGKSLTTLNPDKLLRDAHIFVSWNREAFLERLQRRLHKINDHSEPHGQRAFALTKRYGQLECVQRVKDQYRTTLVEDPCLVSFETSLRWGAQRRALGVMVKRVDDD